MKISRRLGAQILFLAVTFAFLAITTAAEQVPRSPQAIQQQNGLQGVGYNVSCGASGERTPQVRTAEATLPPMMRTFLIYHGNLPTPWLQALAPPAADLQQGLVIADQGSVGAVRRSAGMVLVHGGGSGGMFDPVAKTASNGGGSSWMSQRLRMPAVIAT